VRLALPASFLNHYPQWKIRLSIPLLLASFSAATLLFISPSGFSQAPNIREMSIHGLPNHPIAVTKTRNLQGVNFLRDLEIEVKNVSDNPIYFIRIHLTFPDIKPIQGRGYGFSLYYGDLKLINLDVRAGPKDVPINPGETYVFKVREEIWQGFEDFKSEKNLSASDTNRVELYLQEVSYGDGTGFRSGGPHPRKQTSKNNGPPKAEPGVKQVATSQVKLQIDLDYRESRNFSFRL
jgi:hypothetical protein